MKLVLFTILFLELLLEQNVENRCVGYQRAKQEEYARYIGEER